MNIYKLYGQQGINDEVINHYISIITHAIIKCDSNNIIERVNSIDDIYLNDNCIFYTITDAFKVLKKKHKIKYYIWLQGIVPEERQLRGKNKFDFYLTSFIEKKIINRAKKIFVVSEKMIDHYEKKYNINIKDKSFIMPCYNDTINENSFKTKEKYIKPIFTYIGSMSKWQCIDQTLQLFKKIQNNIPNAELRVYTKSINEIKEKIKLYNITNVVVDCVPNDKVNSVLSEIKYGFIIRDDIAVNNVATPTKFCNYLSAGVIPIMTNSVDFYTKISNNKKYIICEKNLDEIYKTVIEFEKQRIDENKLFKEYKEIFDTYFNDEKNINEMMTFLKNKN